MQNEKNDWRSPPRAMRFRKSTVLVPYFQTDLKYTHAAVHKVQNFREGMKFL